MGEELNNFRDLFSVLCVKCNCLFFLYVCMCYKPFCVCNQITSKFSYEHIFTESFIFLAQMSPTLLTVVCKYLNMFVNCDESTAAQPSQCSSPILSSSNLCILSTPWLSRCRSDAVHQPLGVAGAAHHHLHRSVYPAALATSSTSNAYASYSQVSQDYTAADAEADEPVQTPSTRFPGPGDWERLPSYPNQEQVWYCRRKNRRYWCACDQQRQIESRRRRCFG